MPHVQVEVLTTSGRGARLAFHVHPDRVEAWHHQRLAAVIDRRVTADWLRQPRGSLAVRDLTLSVDWQVDSLGRVAVTLPDVDRWTFSPSELDHLYRRVVL